MDTLKEGIKDDVINTVTRRLGDRIIVTEINQYTLPAEMDFSDLVEAATIENGVARCKLFGTETEAPVTWDETVARRVAAENMAGSVLIPFGVVVHGI